MIAYEGKNSLSRAEPLKGLESPFLDQELLAEKSEEPSLGLLSFRLLVSCYEPIVCAHNACRYLTVPSQVRDFPLVGTDISTYWITQKHWNGIVFNTPISATILE